METPRLKSNYLVFMCIYLVGQTVKMFYIKFVLAIEQRGNKKHATKRGSISKLTKC